MNKWKISIGFRFGSEIFAVVLTSAILELWSRFVTMLKQTNEKDAKYRNNDMQKVLFFLAFWNRLFCLANLLRLKGVNFVIEEKKLIMFN